MSLRHLNSSVYSRYDQFERDIKDIFVVVDKPMFGQCLVGESNIVSMAFYCVRIPHCKSDLLLLLDV